MTAIVNKKIDLKKYGRLLARATPRAIKTERENDRMLAEVDKLMSKGEDKLTPEENELLELFFTLVEDFERQHYPIPEAPPRDVLKTLMEAKSLRQRDLLSIFGSRGITSEVLNGKRGISKSQAKALGEFFHVSPSLFL